ncbi:hypothetical protein [Candidatus Methylobacter oryzae]|uniref:hypothetical protein n=1 Tax=Candidatus Methylobacter oryzae TaxID=2497749 RepID=UPI001F4F9FF5|nr:hypothetical protein [Candidatus Methylobacter oryzae]
MTETVELSGEACGEVVAHRREALAAVPAAGGVGVDVGAQYIVAGKGAVHALQVCPCRTAGRAQTGDNGPIGGGALTVAEDSVIGAVALFGCEVGSGRQIHLGPVAQEIVVAIASRRLLSVCQV